MRKMLNIALIIAMLVYGYYLYLLFFQLPSDPLDFIHLKIRLTVVSIILLTLQFIRSKTSEKTKLIR